MDQRQAVLAQWAADQITQQFSLPADAQLSTVSGDASFRRYFRLTHQDQSWIAVDAPPDKENSRIFVDIARDWLSHGVRVPEVLAFDEAQGFMLLSDFGDQLLWPALNSESVDELYRTSLDILANIQTLPRNGIPEYDRALLDREMELFREWLCEKHLGLKLTDSEHAMLNRVFEQLSASALEQRQVVVHRDYHSRNLMLCDDGGIGVIDFQDAVFGPVTYDLVSLLKDCYIVWPLPQVQGWVEAFRSSLEKASSENSSPEDFWRAFEWMGMQRHLKAAGIFARLSIRDGKHGYLNDVPRTVAYLADTAQRYPEFGEFAEWLKSRFMPALEQKVSEAEVCTDA